MCLDESGFAYYHGGLGQERVFIPQPSCRRQAWTITTMSNPRATLCTLPEELIARIVEFAARYRYSWPRTCKTLSHLSSTCRLLHRLSLPLLYSRLDILTHPLRFLLTIVRNPRLGPLVKHV